MGAIDSTIDRIKQMLVDGELRPGDKLPVEKDLAAGLGVSRNTLREAVRALTTLRVLQTRQGDGTYVTSLEPDLLLDGMGFVADLHGEAGELQFLHVRRLLEPEATALAVGRLTDAELAELGSLLTEADALVASPDVDHQRLMANDRAFHNLITARCGNPVLAALIENASGHTVRARLWRGRVDAGADSRTVAEHRMIYQAIADRDGERARMLAAAHILGVEGAVRALTVPDPDPDPDPDPAERPAAGFAAGHPGPAPCPPPATPGPHHARRPRRRTGDDRATRSAPRRSSRARILGRWPTSSPSVRTGHRGGRPGG